MFNAKTLLEPIDPQHPCGTELTFSNEIDLIAEARREEDPTLDQGEWITDVKMAAWPTVIELCTKLISTKSKDLRFAVWLTEAGAKVHHFAGLNEGYKLIQGLVETYWEDFYPDLNDPDSFEQRIGNISWILSRSIALIKNIPLTEGKSSAYSAIDFEVARKNSNIVDTDNQDNHSQQELLTLATIEAARKKSSPTFYKKLLEDISACQETIRKLEKVVDDKLGMEGPSFALCKETISVIHDMVKRFVPETKAIASSQSQITEVIAEALQLDEQNSTSMHAQHINNRDQALLQLKNVAEFFRRTEPHSPVAYLADKAAHWGQMPLHEWLSTVIKDPSSLSHVEELLGLSAQKEIESNE